MKNKASKASKVSKTSKASKCSAILVSLFLASILSGALCGCMGQRGGSIDASSAGGPASQAVAYDNGNGQGQGLGQGLGQALGQAGGGQSQTSPAVGASLAQPALDDAAVVALQAEQARKVVTTCTARIKKLLPDDRKGSKHQRFLLELSNGTTVLVAHNIDMAPYVPAQAGDIVTVHGEFIWNQRGGVLHWTHHSDTPRHESGYIDFAGNRYQ